MEQQLENSPHWSFPRHVQTYIDTGVDTVLRNSPHLILATSPKDFKKW
jgi:hypothetical protein